MGHSHLPSRTSLWLAFALSLSGIPLAWATNHEASLPTVGAQDVNARTLHILQYHPYPDPQGDPWGIPSGVQNETPTGYMEAAYGAYWYPTAVFDGLLKVEGATQFLETYNAYEAHYSTRRLSDAPLRISLNAWSQDNVAAAQVDLQPKRALASGNLQLRLILFEDEVSFDGGNGVDLHRLVVRALAHEEVISFDKEQSRTIHAMVRLDPSWRLEHLGFVASVHNEDPNSIEFKPDEVLQATTYRFGQEGPTIQSSRGVLLETLTATWCAACVYGDGALDELANAYGHPRSQLLDQTWAYLRPLAWNKIALAFVFGIASSIAVFGLARRMPP